MNRLWIWLAGLFLVGMILGNVLALLLLFEGLYSQENVAQDIQGDFERPTGLRDELIGYYQIHGNWEGIEAFLAQNATRRDFETYWVYQEVVFALVDSSGKFLYETFGHNRAANYWEEIYREPLMVSGEKQADVIFYDTLSILPQNGHYAEIGNELFYQEVLYYITTWTGVSLFIAVGLGLVVSRATGKLAKDVQRFSTGDFSHRVKVRGSRELRQMARSFNGMAASLEKQEVLRRNMLADVTHELRTPLAVLQGNLRAILDGVYKLDYNEILHVYDQTRLLTRLVNDLHQLAQAEAHELKLHRDTVELKTVIEDTVGAFSPIAEEDQIGIQVVYDATIPPLLLDRERITQVLHNLLGNALRHTPAGGNITIRTQSDRQDFRLVVEDTGEGIPEESLPFIFDRFYRIDKDRARSKGGTGLGLAISRAIIEAHGGKISARNMDPGTQFIVRLPASI